MDVGISLPIGFVYLFSEDSTTFRVSAYFKSEFFIHGSRTVVCMIGIMVKWISFNIIVAVGSGIRAHPLKKLRGHAFSASYGGYAKTYDGFDLFALVHNNSGKRKDIVIRFFIVGIAPSDNFTGLVGQIALHFAFSDKINSTAAVIRRIRF